MLNCRRVTEQASDHLHEFPKGIYGWRIRFHLLICSHCRRFRRHMLRAGITASSVAQRIWRTDNSEAEAILNKIKNSDSDTPNPKP
jgi:predicted anti-sigma-YlaC factor YlaD